jgi:hypothetical protein
MGILHGVIIIAVRSCIPAGIRIGILTAACRAALETVVFVLSHNYLLSEIGIYIISRKE